MHLNKCIILGLSLWLIYDGCQGKKTKKKPKVSGRFIPGRTRLSSANSVANPRARSPTLGEALRNRGTPNQRRTSTVGGRVNAGGRTRANRNNNNNFLNNVWNNNKYFSVNARNGVPVHYPSVGKVVPPLRRSEGEKPPFAPSWTHCVSSVQVGIAWVIVTSPGYPNKFQGQVQCSWIASAPDGYGIRLSFKALDLLPPNANGCGNQFVEIIDMTFEKSQARYCGRKTPGDYVSAGNKLRLDLQADAIPVPYKGFMAAFRADTEIPGRRETSYFADGQPQGLYNPLSIAPPSNPRMPRQRVARKPSSPLQGKPIIPGQKIYGSEEQPRLQAGKDEKEEDALESSSTHLYIIIAVIVVILVSAATAYVFKRFFLKKVKFWWKSRKPERSGQQEEDPYAMKKTQLPGKMPLPPTPGLHTSISRNSSFADHDYPFGFNSHMYPQSRPPSYGDVTAYFNGAQGMNEFGSEDWNQEPIYEDDALSVHSTASSLRSTNRHPDHERFKQQKLLERANSMRVRSNSYHEDPAHYTAGGEVYPVFNPYRSNSYHDMRGYSDAENLYGSLPPTFGPGHPNDLYGARPTTPSSRRPLYTSSTTNIPGNLKTHNDFMMQQYMGRSASMHDLSTAGMTQQANVSQPPARNQRLVSSASSTNISTTSTNPILKKTKPVEQNELAFTALRAAKSMNDLTAINTKLNECVSWTLPSQRKSFDSFS